MTSKKILIILPCYGEGATIKKNLPRVCDYVKHHKIDSDVLVIEGNKLDDTADIVEQAQKKYPFVKFISTHNGKGHQIKLGLEYGEYDSYLFMDADLAYPLDLIKKFLNTAKEKKADLVVAVRAQKHKNVLRRIISRILKVLLRLCLGFSQSDTQSGFKLLSRRMRDVAIVKQINGRWIFDIEYFLMAKKHQFVVIDVPVTDLQDDYSNSTSFGTSAKFLVDVAKSGVEFLAIVWRAWRGWYKQ